MVSSPKDLPQLDTEREKERVERAVADLVAAGSVKLEWLTTPTWRELQQRLNREKWHVFHFIGHGGLQSAEAGAPPSFDQETEGFIVLSDGKGGAVEVSASDLKVYLDSVSLRVVVLNCCESARGTPTDNFASPAAALVRRGVSAVIDANSALPVS